MSPLKWLCYGDVGFDYYSFSKEKRKFLGGISLNHLHHLKNLGERDLSFYGPLSKLGEAKEIREYLAKLGVEIEHEDSCLYESMPASQTISIMPDGEKRFDAYNGEIFKKFSYQKLSKDFDVILIPAFEQNQAMVKDFLKEPPQGDIVVDLLDGSDLDFSFLAPFQNKISMVVIGCPQDCQDQFEKLKNSTKSNTWRLLVTRGEKEGFYYDGLEMTPFVPKPVEKVVDTTGAGDAFLTCFLHKIYGGVSSGESLNIASEYTHTVLTSIGPH